MEVLLGRNSWRASALLFLDCGEELADLFLDELGPSQDQDGLVFSWVASEAPQQPNSFSFSVLVEDARQCKFAHV